VPDDGYAWWYVDAISDDGAHGVTVIAFIGSVFSPYYAAARRKGPSDPFQHCALNVALYGAPGRWAMTERGRGDIAVTPERFRIGPSSVAWEDGALVIRIDERTMPDIRPLRGEIRVRPQALVDHEVTLDANHRHRWRPIAPCAEVSVALSKPGLSWTGTGYLDSNEGSEPIEHGFSDWSWSRASLGEDTLVLYDAARRDGSAFQMTRLFGPSGIRDVPAPPPAQLPRGLWRVARPTRADAGTTPRLVRRFEDAPFYTRSEVAASLLGRQAHGVHESLDLNRFSQRWVQTLLPFRMPRIARR
jgi:carotenoid 1,2-hydratase